LGINRPHQTKTAGQFGLTGIAQHLAAGAQHDRQLSRIDVETFNQRLRGWVGFGIEQLMGMTVAAEKTFQPRGGGGVCVSCKEKKLGRPCLPCLQSPDEHWADNHWIIYR
jgi:hypothetical protein